jgi:hypothetical protein
MAFPQAEAFSGQLPVSRVLQDPFGTEAPETQSPETENPFPTSTPSLGTENPFATSTRPPETDAPDFEKPLLTGSTSAPDTEAPVFQDPFGTRAPATEAPETQPPFIATEAPVTDEPEAEGPFRTRAPTTEAPQIQDPQTFSPTLSKTDAPLAPETDAPATELPLVVTTKVPATIVPGPDISLENATEVSNELETEAPVRTIAPVPRNGTSNPSSMPLDGATLESGDGQNFYLLSLLLLIPVFAVVALWCYQKTKAKPTKNGTTSIPATAAAKPDPDGFISASGILDQQRSTVSGRTMETRTTTTAGTNAAQNNDYWNGDDDEESASAHDAPPTAALAAFVTAEKDHGPDYKDQCHANLSGPRHVRSDPVLLANAVWIGKEEDNADVNV